MRRLLLATLVLTALVLPALDGGATADEDVITVRLEWEPGQLGSVTPQQITLADAAPEGVTLPKGLDGLRAGTAALGDVRDLALAVTTERLFVDTDMDGDLSDERGVEWTRAGTTLRAEPTVNVRMSDEAVPVPVPVYVYGPADTITEKLSFYSKAHREGSVVLGGRLRRVALGDGDGNLRFDDAKDVVYVDVDGNGGFSIPHGTHEHIHTTMTFRIGAQAWSPRVPSAGGSVVEFVPVVPAPEPTPRVWRGSSGTKPGTAKSRPDDDLDTLLARFEEEKKRPYAERTATIADIGRTGDDRAASFLFDVAGSDPNVSIKGQCIRAIGNPAYLERAPELVKLANGGNASLASAAIQALYDMGYPDRAKLFRSLLESNNSTVVSAAARYLCYEGDPDSMEAVLAVARQAKVPAVRYAAYNALRNTKEGPPLDLISLSARDSYVSLRARAIEDLALLDHPDTLPLAREAAAVRPVNEALGRAVARVLGAAGDPDGIPLLLALAAEGSETLRREVVTHLAPVRAGGAIAALLKGLSHKEAAVRHLSAQVLAGITSEEVAAVLRKRAKKERDEAAVSAMLEALGDQGDLLAVPLLIKAAKLKRKPIVRDAAIHALARIGLNVPEVRKFFLSLLASKQFEDRVYAIDAAGASGDETLVPKLLPNLVHDRRQVRLATVEALRRLRSAMAVRPMIERLEEEEVQRIRNEIGRALFESTGMHLYDEHALWEQWWADTRGQFKVPEQIPVLPASPQGGTGAAFYGIPIDSDRVCFVIDQSGSMSAEDATGLVGTGDRPGNRLDVAVQEALRALKQMPDDAYANVILFHSTIHPWKDELVRLGKKNRAALAKDLLQKRPTGGTNLYDGLEVALLDREVDTILLLSDGVPGSGRYVATDDILRAVRRLNQTRRIVIHCVSLGRDSELMKRLAEQNAGKYVRR